MAFDLTGQRAFGLTLVMLAGVALLALLTAAYSPVLLRAAEYTFRLLPTLGGS